MSEMYYYIFLTGCQEGTITDLTTIKSTFDGKTVIPFCTSSSSGLGRSGKNLADNAKSGNWLEGKRFGAGTSKGNALQ